MIFWKNSLWVSGLYLMQSIPYALVTFVASVFYKEINISNTDIAFYTSLFTLPWTLKFFISPLFENNIIKSKIIYFTELWISIFIFILVFWFYFFSNRLILSGILFGCIAIIGAIHDIASDGLYLEALSHQEQARYIGLRTAFYHLGKLFCQSFIIYLVSLYSWWAAILCLAIITFSIAQFNNIKMQAIPQKTLHEFSKTFLLDSYLMVMKKFREIPHIYIVIAFIFTYNTIESQVIKIFPLFMLDQVQQGGLGLTPNEVALIYGVIGPLGILLGATLSGFFISRFSLKNCIIPFTVFGILTLIPYWLAAVYIINHLVLITIIVVIGALGFGISNGGYMFYLVNLSAKRKYSMSLYTLGTAIMLFSMLLSGGISGYLQSLLGYSLFFLALIVAGIAMIGFTIYMKIKTL